MGRKETIMYCFRLNINNPDHLALHKILRDIDDKEHTTKSSYIIEVLKKQLLYNGDELMTADDVSKQGGYVTKQYVDELGNEIYRKLESEIKRELFNTIISLTAGNGKRDAPVERAKVEEVPSEQGKKEADEALRDLTKLWS